MQNPGQEEGREGVLQRVKRKSFELTGLPCCSRNYTPGGRKIQCIGLPKTELLEETDNPFGYQNSFCMILCSGNTGLSSGVTPLDWQAISFK